MADLHRPPGTTDAVEVVVDPDQVDLISGILWSSGVSAIAEHALDDERVVLRSDLPPGGMDTVRSAVGHLIEEIHAVTIHDDGLDAWRDHAQVSRAGTRLVVHPPWLPLPDVGADDVVIELDPGRSWGHGAHPTTRLCLTEIERVVDEHPGCGVIDVGCGSGVLAIAAARLGAGWVEAYDVDPAALEATSANAAVNDVTDIVTVHPVPPERTADPFGPQGAPADLIVANIGAATLVELAPTLTGRLAPGGILVLSGLLDPVVADVAPAYAPCRLNRTASLDGWTVLVLS